jgi:hypothetical protein
MQKVLLAVFGFVAAVQAAAEIKITPKHYLKASPTNLVKSLLKPKLQGAVTWGECAGGDGDFAVDLSSTYSVPTVPVKGINVELELHGTFTNDVDLAGLKVYVTWDNTPLYTNDFARTKHYAAGDSYKDEITWLIPSFAPSGHYSVQITLHDKDNKTIFDCISADFDL